MNNSWSYLFIFIGLLLFPGMACKNKLNNGTTHAVDHTHEYGEEHDQDDFERGASPTTVDSNFGKNSSVDIYGSADRRNWQKPHLIIPRLGNLEGKTIADIGAGPYGYFTFRIVSRTKAEKVIAIDIDKNVTTYIDSMKLLLLSPELQRRVETRLVAPDNPQLNPGEADVVIMVNTFTFIDNRIEYLKKLKEGISSGGSIYIIDFKKRRLPIGPPTEDKLADFEVEIDLEQAGYSNINVDDQLLDYQYIISATNGSHTVNF